MQKESNPKTQINNNNSNNKNTRYSHTSITDNNFHQAFQPPQFPIIPDWDGSEAFEKRLGYKEIKTPPNTEVCRESLGAMFEYR